MSVYVSTAVIEGVEKVVCRLPLSEVPGFDPDNKPHPNTYLAEDVVAIGWVYENGSFIPPSAPIHKIPQSISALQGLLALDAVGMASAYTTWASAPERTFAQRAFIDKAQTWRRDDPTLAAAATDFGLTAQQVDDLFMLASTL